MHLNAAFFDRNANQSGVQWNSDCWDKCLDGNIRLLRVYYIAWSCTLYFEPSFLKDEMVSIVVRKWIAYPAYLLNFEALRCFVEVDCTRARRVEERDELLGQKTQRGLVAGLFQGRPGSDFLGARRWKVPHPALGASLDRGLEPLRIYRPHQAGGRTTGCRRRVHVQLTTSLSLWGL